MRSNRASSEAITKSAAKAQYQYERAQGEVKKGFHSAQAAVARPFRVSICAARTLNATGQCRVTLSRW